eukprot:CAMPEP_0181092432 /NCGR_PEP_ID=MMETSP1071-20121207/8916_1 /TAXON_ID=35127 /ORGANISM="Thalassiosira sp., Strain NH16" /LENGTH=771 /DNA_ID=CAMNT_0023174613 /DNA_START=26 /DNA_END=2341 /DNA_ORIENTATION=+
MTPIPITVAATSTNSNSPEPRDDGNRDGHKSDSDNEDDARDGASAEEQDEKAVKTASTASHGTADDDGPEDDNEGMDEGEQGDPPPKGSPVAEIEEQDVEDEGIDAANGASDSNSNGPDDDDLGEAVVEPEDIEEQSSPTEKGSSEEADDTAAGKDTVIVPSIPAIATAAAGYEPEETAKPENGGEDLPQVATKPDATKADGPSKEPSTPEGKTNDAEASSSSSAAKEKPPRDDAPLPPPAWADVTFDKLVNYPKSLLHARSYFDMQQIRAIKPVTLLAMGISVPNFPDLEGDGVIRIATHRGTKFQLYHPSEVFTSKSRAKPYLQKEMLRRAILHNLSAFPLGEDVAHADIPKKNLLRKGDGRRSGIPTYLPRPGSYTLAQCHNWLLDHPPPEAEQKFLVRTVRQWRQQVRDQIVKITPKNKETDMAIAAFDAEKENDEEDEEEEGRTRADVSAAAAAGDGVIGGPMNFNAINSQLETAFANYRNQFVPPQVINSHFVNSYSSQLSAATNMNNIQAQAIRQYQAQLAEMQTQLEKTDDTATTRFEIRVEKDTFKFNASHFVAYPGFRERLHGHNYRTAVKVIGSDKIGRDGYVLDFGCVKTAVKDICKEMNEYFIVPTLSDVLTITVVDDAGDEVCDLRGKSKKKRKRKSMFPGSIMILTEDGSTFVFPRQDCLMLPIMHTTAEEFAVYIYGKILDKLNTGYLLERGVTAMEVTVSEAVGQDAVFRRPIPKLDEYGGGGFDVASYISEKSIPVMPCRTDTEAAVMKQRTS